MKRFALIGEKLGHSYSKRWFEDLFAREGLQDYSYTLVEMSSLEGVRDWVREEGISGFNVTVPYKQKIIPYLDELDETAAAIGAVNCVTVCWDAACRVRPNQAIKLIGHNTDAPAFQQTLEHALSYPVAQSRSHPVTQPLMHSFILGTGGAARAVAYALTQMGIKYIFVSRTPEKHENAISYQQLFTSHLWLHKVADHSSPLTLIVNATPVGMYPDVDRSPLELNDFQFSISNSQFVYDLIYNPSPTRLLREAAALGAQTKDGLEMLHRQAELSWKWFQ